jgi:hypothetical protein
VRGQTFRFVTTHLEPESTNPLVNAVQAAQANELLTGPANTPLPVILVGDFNSRADGTGTATYSILVGAGFKDAWSATHPRELGNTWGHAADLRNTTVNLTQRLDLVLFRGDVRALDADVLGEELRDRTRSGLWPSDHAGVVATLGLRPQFGKAFWSAEFGPRRSIAIDSPEDSPLPAPAGTTGAPAPAHSADPAPAVTGNLSRKPARETDRRPRLPWSSEESSLEEWLFVNLPDGKREPWE